MTGKFPKLLAPNWVLSRTLKDGETEWFYTNSETDQRFYCDEDLFSNADYEKTLLPLLESWKGTDQRIFSLKGKKLNSCASDESGSASATSSNAVVLNPENKHSTPRPKIKRFVLENPGAARRQAIRENLKRLREEQAREKDADKSVRAATGESGGLGEPATPLKPAKRVPKAKHL